MLPQCYRNDGHRGFWGTLQFDV